MLINILAFPLYILPPSARGDPLSRCKWPTVSFEENRTKKPSLPPLRDARVARARIIDAPPPPLSLSLTKFPLFLSQVSPPRRVGEIEGRRREVSLGGENGEKGEITRASNGRRDFFQVKLRPLILLTSDRGERDDARCRWLLEILSGEGEGGV